MIPLCTYLVRGGKPCEARAVFMVRVLGGAMKRPRCEAHAFLYPASQRDRIVVTRL